jgi:WD40 repeat protein/serine/threonine protein kinase
MPTARACPDLAVYQRLVAGQLSSTALEDLLGHLETCGACTQRLEGLADTDNLVDLLRQAQTKREGAAGEVVTRLVERIRALRPAASAPPKPADRDRIQVTCSGCGKSLKVKSALAGKKGKCPHCQAMIAVPSAAPPAVDQRTLPPQAAEARTIAPVGPEGSAIRRTPDGTAIPEGGGATQAPHGDADPDRCDFLAPAQAPDEIGRLGPYRVLQVLGAGGMGVVFKAEDPQLQRLVALKAMLPGLATSGSAKQRFLREARAAAALKHDHIVTIHQVGEDRGAPFLAMEFLEGEPLDKLLERERTLPLAEVLRIGREIADGLHAAHERGLTHRDIKPANVWLEGKRARVKILDFGLARGSADDAQLTQQGAIVGTPAYMAPEQAQGKSIGPRCDLFSLGCVLYRMATGEPPFRGTDTISTLLAVATENPMPPQELEPRLPPALSKLIMSLLAKEPDDRPASAQVVVETLDRIARKPGSPSAPTRTAPRPKRGKPQGRSWRWAAVAGTAVVVLGLGTWLLMATVFKVKVKTSTCEALVVLEIDQPGAEVLVDGTKMTVNVPGDNKPIEIKVEPGGHKLRISKEGFEAVTRDVELNLGKSPPIRVALAPLKPPTTEAAGGPAIPPSPALEAMRRENISPEGLAAAGGGDPSKAPKSLVGVLGEPAPVHTAQVGRMAFSTDGRWLASASHDGTVILWEVATARAQRVFRGHTRAVNGVAFSTDGRTLITASDDGTVKIWATDKDTEPKTLNPDLGEIKSLAASPDGRFVAAGGSNGTLKLSKRGEWDKPVTVAKVPVLVTSIAFSPDGEFLAAGWDERRPEPEKSAIRVYKTADNSLVHTLPAHVGGVNTVAISRDGKLLASTGNDGKVKLWELPSGKPVPGEAGAFYGVSVAFSADGKSLAWGNRDGVRIADIPFRTGQDPKHVVQGWGWYWGLAFSPDGKVVAVGDDWGTVNFYDPTTWQLVNKDIVQRGHRDAILGVSVSPDGHTVLTSGHDRTLRRWDLDRPRENQILDSTLPHAPGVKYSPDGKTIAEWNIFTPPTIYDASGKQRYKILIETHACAWSPDSKILAIACRDGQTHLWDVADNKDVYHVAGGSNVAFSADGKFFAVANETKTVKVWNVESGVEAKPWDDVAVGNLTYSPDGKLLALGNLDGTITLWDTAKRTKLRTWSGHSRRPGSLKFTPDSKTLVSSAEDGTVRVWNTEWERAREVIPLGVPNHYLVIDLDPSGKYVIAVGHNPAIFVLRLPTTDAAAGR